HWRRILARNSTRPRRRRRGATPMAAATRTATTPTPHTGPRWADVTAPAVTAPPPRAISTLRPQTRRTTASMKTSAGPSSGLRMARPDQVGEGGEGTLDDGLAGRPDERRGDGDQ